MATAETQTAVYPELLISPPGRWSALKLGELWEYRQLLFFLTWRDLKVRYKQTVLGASWAILQPLLRDHRLHDLLREGRATSRRRPSVSGLLVFRDVPWTYSRTRSRPVRTAWSLAATMIAKVYFPRIALPISAVLGAAFDLVCAPVMLVIPSSWRGTASTVCARDVPLFFLLACATALGIGSFLLPRSTSATATSSYVVPFLIQIWIFVTPVVYCGTS